MFKPLKNFFIRLRRHRHQKKSHSDLDSLLSSAGECKSLEDKLDWMVRLLRWIRHQKTSDIVVEISMTDIPLVRLRFLLRVLERNPQWQKDVALILQTAIQEVSSFELFAETGFPQEIGLWGELGNRLMQKLLPPPPLENDLGHLFWSLFPDEKDADWLAKIDQDSFEKILTLFSMDLGEGELEWSRLKINLQDALTYLVIQVRAIGLSPAMLRRLETISFNSSAFYDLNGALEEYFYVLNKGDGPGISERSARLRMILWRCHQEIKQVHSHLDTHGVSIGLVFQMMRLNLYLKRIESLLDMTLYDRMDPVKITRFLSMLVEENQELRSIGTLLSQNVALFARKCVERAAETGEHYITRTKEEYRQMLQAACGGGAITTITVYVKLGIMSLGLAGFIEGVLAALNYSLSFVGIHLLGFTLGTKQPAMTAPALAAKLEDVDSPQGMESLVTEITHLIRSQVASVVGNLLFVVPLSLTVNVLYFALFGKNIMSVEKARYALHSVDIFGPAFLYAAFTGILLWASSIFAGWGDNWFALHSLRKTLARSPSLRALFGKRGARGLAIFLQNNMSGLVGNISLGILLGLIPGIMKFMAIPLDIRHITLSSGTLGAALPVLGVSALQSWEFLRAILGIICIGFFNVSVSFALAFYIAIKAQGLKPPQRLAVRRAVIRRFWQRPWSFFFPVGTNEVSKGPS